MVYVMLMCNVFIFFFSSRRRHTRCALVTGVQTCALPILQKMTMRFLLGHSETAVREIAQGVAPADQRIWGQALDIMSDIPTFWYSLADAERSKPMHVVLTAPTKFTEDEVNNQTTRTTNAQRGAKVITLATPDSNPGGRGGRK